MQTHSISRKTSGSTHFQGVVWCGVGWGGEKALCSEKAISHSAFAITRNGPAGMRVRPHGRADLVRPDSHLVALLIILIVIDLPPCSSYPAGKSRN